MKKADVSLNKARATIQLKPENQVTIEQLRKVVRKSGFTPKEAEIILDGRLKTEEGNWFVVTGPEEHYRLVPSPKEKEEAQQKWKELKEFSKENRIRVTAYAPPETAKEEKQRQKDGKKKTEPLTVHLLDFKQAPKKK